MSHAIEMPAENVVGIEAGLVRLAKATNQEVPGDGVRMPTVNMSQPLSHAAHEIGQILADAPIFLRGKEIVTISREGEIVAMKPTRFHTWVERYLYTTTERRDGDVIQTMLPQYAVGILQADNFREQLREIKAVNTVRMPAWRGTGEIKANRSMPFWLVAGSDWHVELLPAGYDDATGVYTMDRVPYDESMTLEDATEFLADNLKGFQWAKEEGLGNTRSLGVHMAAMVGVFCHSMFKSGTVRPLVPYIGNQPGNGKSLLLTMALCPVHGIPALKDKPSNEELRKELDIAAMQRKPYLAIDDVGSLHSHELNRFVSAQNHEPRILGTSETAGLCPNVTHVFCSGNQLSMSTDLVRRSIVVDLFDPSKSIQRKFEKVITLEWLELPETRAKFLAALWAIVREWDAAGRPHDPDARHSSAPLWASVIGSIVKHFNPKLNPFAERVFDTGGDESGAALEALLCGIATEQLASGVEFKTSQLIDIADERGLLEPIAGHAKDMRKALGHLIKKMAGRELTDEQGRVFEFAKRTKSFGSVYYVRFHDA